MPIIEIGLCLQWCRRLTGYALPETDTDTVKQPAGEVLQGCTSLASKQRRYPNPCQQHQEFSSRLTFKTCYGPVLLNTNS